MFITDTVHNVHDSPSLPPTMLGVEYEALEVLLTVSAPGETPQRVHMASPRPPGNGTYPLGIQVY